MKFATVMTSCAQWAQGLWGRRVDKGNAFANDHMFTFYFPIIIVTANARGIISVATGPWCTPPPQVVNK